MKIKDLQRDTDKDKETNETVSTIKFKYRGAIAGPYNNTCKVQNGQKLRGQIRRRR